MKLIGVISTAVLCLTLGAAALVYAQEQHEQQEEQKAKPAQDEKKAQPAKPAQDEKKAQPAKQEEKGAQQQEKNTKPEEKNAQQAKPAAQAKTAGGRIPDDRYKANFGREHTFHVSQGDYGNRRFQYGGYWFGFAGAWPSNWLYTQNVYVVEINGVYYLCNPMYPGVNVELSVTI